MGLITWPRSLAQHDGMKRWTQVVTELPRTFALCAASDDATAIRRRELLPGAAGCAQQAEQPLLAQAELLCAEWV